MLTSDQLKLLRIIANESGNINWYRIGRLHLSEFTSPAEFAFSMQYLIDESLVEEKLTGDTQLPNLLVTKKGFEEVARHEELWR